jgi:hypothetical protein
LPLLTAFFLLLSDASRVTFQKWLSKGFEIRLAVFNHTKTKVHVEEKMMGILKGHVGPKIPLVSMAVLNKEN